MIQPKPPMKDDKQLRLPAVPAVPSSLPNPNPTMDPTFFDALHHLCHPAIACISHTRGDCLPANTATRANHGLIMPAGTHSCPGNVIWKGQCTHTATACLDPRMHLGPLSQLSQEALHWPEWPWWPQQSAPNLPTQFLPTQLGAK